MLELIGMLGGGTFGALTAFISDYLADKRKAAQEKHERKMAEKGLLAEHLKNNLQLEKTVPGLSFRRTLLAIIVVLAVVGILYFPHPDGTNLPITVRLETTWFWIYTTTEESVKYINVKGGVLLKEHSTAFIVIITMVFGNLGMKRRNKL